MRHEEQVHVIRTLMDHLDQGTNVDAGVIGKVDVKDYTSPERAALEWTAFFKDHPQVVGMSGDLPTPGSFITANDFGVPLLATRAASSRAVTSTLAASGEQAARIYTSAHSSADGWLAHCTIAGAPSRWVHVVMRPLFHVVFAVFIDALLVVWFCRPVLCQLLAFKLQPFYSMPDVVYIHQGADGIFNTRFHAGVEEELVLFTPLRWRHAIFIGTPDRSNA